MANKFDMGKVEKQVRTQLEASLVLMGRTAKTFFYDNFRKQGFDDKSVKRWERRKGEVGGFGVSKKSAGSRAVLVKTGDLRRSIRVDNVNKANLSVKIATDLPYAKIHNDGGIVDRKAHKRTSTITTTVQGSGSFVNGVWKKGKKAKLTLRGERHNVKASAFKMPKRQFIGDSWNLNEKVKKVIVTNLNKAFK